MTQTEHDDGSGSWTADPIVVTIHLAFAFDIGDEIDLDRARLDPARRARPVTAAAAHAGIDSGIGPRRFGSSSSRRHRAAGRVVVPPAPARRADAVRLRRDLAVRAVPGEDDARRSAGAGRPAWRSRLRSRRPPGDLLAPGSSESARAVYDFAVSEMSEEYIVFQLWDIAAQLAGRRAPTGSPGSCGSSPSRSAPMKFARPLA